MDQSPADEPVLSIEGLTVALPAGADRRHAVENIDLRVERGEVFCVVGESGSGKSVTAFTIMGLLPKGQLRPVAGRVRLLGESLLDARSARLRQLRGTRMGMIFQEPATALNPVLDCGEQIDEVLRIHTDLSAGKRRARILEALAEVQLPEPERVFRSYPHELSGGQRQRIMIAMALILEPALLLADEPTTALDVTTQAHILQLIRDLQARHGTAVLFITHDFGVVAEIADRVAVMQAGRIVETGTREEVLRQPRNDYTRMLIEAVPSLTPRERGPRRDAPIVLDTKGLAKTYAGRGFIRKGRVVKAAEAIDLELRRGETLGLVGESGSGKSTVARCVARLIDPSDGEVWLEGQDIATLPERRLRPFRRRVQVIFQDPYRSLNPRRTIAASITEGLSNQGVPAAKAHERARELMSLVRLDPEALDRYPHQFSGGQRQRIAIARALALDPQLLIADEAVSALDVSVQTQVLKLLADVQEKLDLAMLFITHDLRVAAQVCDRIAVMQRGRIVEMGPVGEIYARPGHDYTRTLLASAPGRGFNFTTSPAGG